MSESVLPVPPVLTRYFAAADTKNFGALAECFTADAAVTDEGHTYRGRDEIIGWREELAGKWSFTSTITDSAIVSTDEYRTHVRVEGNFPGGVAALTYRFIVRDDTIAELSIVG